MTRRAIFLDRDGTLNVDVGFTHRVEDLVLEANVGAGLRHLQALGFELIITTNQSGIARGHFSEAEMHAFNEALCDLLTGGGIRIAGIYHCPFHPTAGRGSYRRESELRKPRPGMLLTAASEHRIDLASSFAIGDRLSDVLAGQAAGCRSILVQTGMAGRDEPHLTAEPDFVAADLADAARWVERVLHRRRDAPVLGSVHLAGFSHLTAGRGVAW
ncbi:MAG: HAD family hydrolase [Planctomycetota bacterium]|nr:MAG: HAD family hydrolase [Planctomycetota bacterium]